MFRGHTLVALALACCGWGCFSAPLCWSAEPSAVEAQPLRANVQRLMAALEYLGAPLAAETRRELRRAPQLSAQRLQALLDPHVLAVVSINPELRVKVQRGAARARLQQAGFTPCLIKVENQGTVTRKLQIDSPQAGAVYSGAALGILKRQAQTELNDNENTQNAHRFLEVEMFDQSPMTVRLSGLQVEYLIALIFSSEAGKREATLVFDIGQGTQDLGFRSEVPVLFEIQPGLPVKMQVRDFDGQPTTARLEFRDADGRVYPPQAKRLAPDFFFQPQIYRQDGDVVILPPGKFELTSSRGPEYQRRRQEVVIAANRKNVIDVRLQRWVNPMKAGFFCGDHHIHGAGCSHYDNPTQGVTPQDMFTQVKGEGLNVGCVLTWGPCFDYQRRFFSPRADDVSEPLTRLKYDLEISGFGSAALGHVCLLDLENQTYPGSQGTKTTGWPSWTVPVMRWTKEQGGVTGYPHSALHVVPESATNRLLELLDRDTNQQLDRQEAERGLLPEAFASIDTDGDGQLIRRELLQSNERVSQQLPNVALPAMNGGGAMEIFVSTAEGVCDFISAMDTARIPEWNTWYHLMNAGFPLKLSGETDFPCMSSRRVGQGRVYVQMGALQKLDYSAWCQRLAQGRSYVSDGFAHALEFRVEGLAPGEGTVQLAQPNQVQVVARVAFAAEQPKAVAYGTVLPAAGRRMAGDTVNLHAPRDLGVTRGGERLVEMVLNGRVVASQKVPADGQEHALTFQIPVEQSSWIALRQFPQLHTNPVEVQVAGRPIRASRQSALWCVESIRLLWKNRRRFIRDDEQPAAREAYERSIATFLQRARECPDDGTGLAGTGLD